MHSSFKKFCQSLAAGIVLVGAAIGANAQLINGDFAMNGGAGQLTVNTTLTAWTGGGREGLFGSQTTPPVFVFDPGDTNQLSVAGVNGDAFMGNVVFFGATSAPNNGVVIAADGDPDWAGSIEQTVNGLTPGDSYTLEFYWAGAQQQGFSGDTTERWDVTFGADMMSTATVNTPSQSFAGWQTSSMSFTATSSSQLLKFLAVGAPGGVPPWLLLSGVTLTPSGATNVVPEPGTYAFIGGLVLTGAVYLRRRRK